MKWTAMLMVVAMLCVGSSFAGVKQTPARSSLADAARSLAEAGKVTVVPAAKGSAKATVEKDATTVPLPTGPSPVALLKLPVFSAPYDLWVHSMCNCFGFTKSIFVPSATLFDAEFNETRSMAEVDFSPNNGNGFRISAEVLMTAERAKDRFMAIYTVGDRVGERGGKFGDPRQGLVGVIFTMPFSRAANGTIQVQTSAPKTKK